MTKLFTLKLVTPVKIMLEKQVESVTVNTEDGEITVLANHIPLVSILRPGQLIARSGDEETPISVSGGVIEIFNNTLLILADTAEHPSEIDLKLAEQKAAQLAQKLAGQEKMDLTTYKLLQRQLEKEQSRIGTVKRWKK